MGETDSPSSRAASTFPRTGRKTHFPTAAHAGGAARQLARGERDFGGARRSLPPLGRAPRRTGGTGERETSEEEPRNTQTHAHVHTSACARNPTHHSRGALTGGEQPPFPTPSALLLTCRRSLPPPSPLLSFRLLAPPPPPLGMNGKGGNGVVGGGGPQPSITSTFCISGEVLRRAHARPWLCTQGQARRNIADLWPSPATCLPETWQLSGRSDSLRSMAPTAC